MRAAAKIRNAVFGGAVAVALGFGATQVVAAPAAPDQQTCNPKVCDNQCRGQGYMRGSCGTDGICRCLL